MGDLERANLMAWCAGVVGNHDLIAEDPRGKKVGEKGHELRKGERLKTFCNIATQAICAGAGYHDFDGMLANKMRDHAYKHWIRPAGLTGDKLAMAHQAAMIGDLALLAFKGDPHGHIAVVAPVKPVVYSGKWGFYCPIVANVGGAKADGTTANGLVGANYAFAQMPEVFILGRVLS